MEKVLKIISSSNASNASNESKQSQASKFQISNGSKLMSSLAERSPIAGVDIVDGYFRR